MNIDLPTALKIAGTIVGLAGAAGGGYRAWHEYDLLLLNDRIQRCQLSELRNAHMKGTPVTWECHKIALEYAGMLEPKKSPAD